MINRYIVLWIPMIVIAFANATLRELVLINYMSVFRAHQLSTITLILFCTVYTWFVFPSLKIQNSRQAFMIGLIWTLFTIAFEFTLGRLTNKTWEYLFQNYDLFSGNLWVLFLVCLFFLPYVVYVYRKK